MKRCYSCFSFFPPYVCSDNKVMFQGKADWRKERRGEADQVPLPPLHSLHSIYEDSKCILRPVYRLRRNKWRRRRLGNNVSYSPLKNGPKRERRRSLFRTFTFVMRGEYKLYLLPFAESNSGKK